MHGNSLIQQLTGEYPVHPGHPLVIAAVIMSVYPSLEAALEKTEGGSYAVHADGRVPGCGAEVDGAISMLRLGSDGASAEGMIEYANSFWVVGKAGGNEKYVDAGVAQAQKIEPYFREQAAEWFKITEPTS
jgi:hypothetical protein